MNDPSGFCSTCSEHPRGRQHVDALAGDVARRHVLHRLGRAAASGSIRNSASGCSARISVMSPAGCRRVRGAPRPRRGSGPSLGIVDQAGLALDERRRATCPGRTGSRSRDRATCQMCSTIADGVGGGAAVVGLSLDLGRRVDVHHDHRPGCSRLPGDELLGGDRVGQRAARRRGRGSARSSAVETPRPSRP